MNVHERLALFYERLQAASPPRNAAEAFALIGHTLEEVEAEFCPVPSKDPPPTTFDGRMYRPQQDNVKEHEDGSWWVKTRRHRIRIRQDGSFVIYRLVAGKKLLEEFRKGGSA